MFWPECLSGKEKERTVVNTQMDAALLFSALKQSQIPRGPRPLAFGFRRLYDLMEGERGCVDGGRPTPTPPTLVSHQMGPAWPCQKGCVCRWMQMARNERPARMDTVVGLNGRRSFYLRDDGRRFS